MSKCKQTTLFDYLDLKEYPIYKQLQELEINKFLEINDSSIIKRKDGYEIENEYYHEGFLDVNQCYELIIEFLHTAIQK